MSEPLSAEIPKRLAPTLDTVRHLFAHSGNVCAFPGCSHPLIDAENNFLAEVCHIEAAEPGGERFNPQTTNEERRHRNNLLLLCHRHHVETNNVERWTVEKMRELKAEHERRFEESVARIVESSITGITKAATLGEPTTLAAFGAFLGLNSDESLGSLDHSVRPLFDRLRKLAPETRALLTIVLERSENYFDDLGLRLSELEQVTGLGPRELKPHLDTLDRYGITHLDEDFEGRWWVGTRALDGWPFWREVKAYCEGNDISLATLVDDLRFDLLD